MVTRTTTYEYEQSSEGGRERMLPMPFTRLTDATPTLGDPAQVTGLIAGLMITGTVINPGTTADPYAVLNVADGAVFKHNVRNTLTYGAGPVAEATWGALNLGDPVYYSAEQDVLNGIKLSTSPLQSDGATANTLFGHIVLEQDETSASFPKGTVTASTHVCAIQQV